MSPPKPVTERTRTISPPLPVDLRLTLGPLRRGRLDPSMRFEPGGVWRATRTPAGPVTTHLRSCPADGTVTIRAWGPGAEWALETFPALVGAEDTEDGFDPGTGVVADLHRRLRGLRISRSGAVVEALVPSILEQKVVGLEARRSYARLVRNLGEAAPGPAVASLIVPPPAKVLAATPTWTFHRAGVERKRADTICRACSYAARLEETVHMSPDDARRRLTALPGTAPGQRPRSPSSPSATPTPSVWATTTFQTRWRGPWPARPGPTMPGCSSSSNPGGVIGPG